MRVVFAPEVEEDLYGLIKILVEKEYLGTYPFAISYVEELIADIQQNIHSKLKKKAPVFFERYGKDMYYITYQRNSNTTWYIFFSVIGDTYFIKYITNNHVSGQYIFYHISMNILITGIHGFVGSNLVVALKERHSLYGLDIVAPEKEGVVKTFFWKDIEPASFPMRNLPEFDAIIHLAGKAHDTKNRSAAQSYFDINTGLTQKIFDFFLESSAKKFVFFSSVKAAADSVAGDMLTEDVVPAPVGPYGESKIAAENYILDKLKVENGELKANPCDDKQVYILRPCMIHGPGNKGNLNLLYNVVKKGVPWPLGAFENRRSFTSIDNLCYVVKGLLTKEVASGIYHMGDDEALSTNELIALMCRALDRKPHIWKINRGLMEFCARFGTLLHLPLNEERLRKLTENYVVSNAKIKAALGIDRMPVRAEEGIVRTIKSFSNIKVNN